MNFNAPNASLKIWQGSEYGLRDSSLEIICSLLLLHDGKYFGFPNFIMIHFLYLLTITKVRTIDFV